jgi:hypothetical protein
VCGNQFGADLGEAMSYLIGSDDIDDGAQPASCWASMRAELPPISTSYRPSSEGSPTKTLLPN